MTTAKLKAGAALTDLHAAILVLPVPENEPQQWGFKRALRAASALVLAHKSEIRNDWMEAVIDSCAVACLDWNRDDPRKTIERLIAWNVQIALDPQVSDAAHQREVMTVPPDNLPKWIDNLKGKDPTIDGLIEYIALNALMCQSEGGAIPPKSAPCHDCGANDWQGYYTSNVRTHLVCAHCNFLRLIDTAAPRPPAVVDERAAFEVWAKKDGTYDLRPAKWRPVSHGGVPHNGYIKPYENDRTRHAFEGFCAAISAVATAPAARESKDSIDARRYRWLRKHSVLAWPMNGGRTLFSQANHKDLDDEIDRCMQSAISTDTKEAK